MQKIFKKTIAILIICLLSACNLPGLEQAAPDLEANVETDTPSQDHGPGECAFMWATKPLPELSDEFNQALESVQVGAEGYAQAYGENCVTSEGDVASFHAMETDFYTTLEVESLEDEQALGELIENVMRVLADFPTDETPGPQPGYVGITFEALDSELKLWVMRTEVEAALENGLHGVELYNILKTK